MSEFLMDYVAGALPAPSLTTFERHLQTCTNCREFLKQYRDTIRAGRIACDQNDAKAPALPEDLVKAILAAVEQAK